MNKKHSSGSKREQNWYHSTEALASAEIHKSPTSTLCLSSNGTVESWILDSEHSYQDCGARIISLCNSTNFERNKEQKQRIRVVRSSRSASLYAPKKGYRYDGEYEVEEMRRLLTEKNGIALQPILKKCVPGDLPLRAPYDKLHDLAHKHELSFHVSYDGPQPRIAMEMRFPVSVWFEPARSDAVFAYLYCRTSSWNIDGERTDWHDVVTTLLAAFLRWNIEVSCSLWDQPNQWGLPVELYGRYITLDQPNGSVFALKEEGIGKIDRFLSSIKFFGLLFPHLLSWTHTSDVATGADCKERGGFTWDNDEVSRWKRRISVAIRESASDESTANFRSHPDWKYYRNLKKGISIIEAARPSTMLSTLIEKVMAESVESIATDRGEFLVSGDLKNFVSRSLHKRARGLMSRLYPEQSPCFLPMENMMLALTKSAIMTLRHECGLNAFNRAKLAIKPRHDAETRLLFPPSLFEWTDPVDDEVFECLVHELLAVEPGVTRVRRTGSSRDSDQGRDLIIDWKTEPLGTQTDKSAKKEGFLETRRVVGQCKASSRAIGKADVTDIRDTVGHHDCTGYFLATALRITSDLASHLDALRVRAHIWTEWWTRTEIEHRLRAHPEIAVRYQTLIRPRIG